MAGGLATDRLARMHASMAGYVERGEVPGLITAVSRRGELHVDCIGDMHADRPSPVQRDTIFRISSMTKPVTAVAAMILVEECRLRLDDPVDAFLPELADRRVLRSIDSQITDTVAAGRPLTTRDLLTFRLGFGQLMAASDAYPILRAAHDKLIGMGPPDPAGIPDPDEWLRRLGELPLMYQPGERWMYNTGSDVLGVLVARAAGQPFGEFLRERIFEPLGMADTGFSVAGSQVDRLATSYSIDHATGARVVFDQAAGGGWTTPPAFPAGGGGLVSTVDDYLAFAAMMAGTGPRILARPSLEVMTTDHLTAAQKAVSGLTPGFFDSFGWGFGVSVRTRRDDVAGSVGTFGWDGGLGTTWYHDPREELTTILLTQQAWTNPVQPPVARDFLTLAYQAIDD